MTATDPSLQAWLARQQVEDCVVRLFVATDERDWPTLVGCCTSPMTLDMTSMVGGEPQQMTPQQVADAWAAGFAPIDHVHHQIGNLRTRVDGDRATVRAHGFALHHRAGVQDGPRTRLFVGTYTLELAQGDDAQWRVSLLRFTLKFIDGRLDLEAAR